MDSPKEATEYNEMDHSEVNRQFVEDLLAFAESDVDKHEPMELEDVLDMGTGTALIPIELCKHHPDCRVMAIDMAISMLDLARYNVEAKGMRERITLAQVDAKQMGYADGIFDVVMSNSIIHHIPEPDQCLAEMVRVAAEPGIIFIRDLMRPDDVETLERVVNQYAGQESEYSQKLFRDSLHAALSLAEIQEKVSELGFEASSVNATSDRHWTWAARKNS